VGDGRRRKQGSRGAGECGSVGVGEVGDGRRRKQGSRGARERGRWAMGYRRTGMKTEGMIV
jgi:hypothetical protein